MNVEHHEGRQAFTVNLGAEEAELTYTRPEDGVVDLNHTFVPPTGRQKGVAAEMVKTALAWARAQGLKVVPTCPYVDAFVRKHKEYADLVQPRA